MLVRVGVHVIAVAVLVLVLRGRGVNVARRVAAVSVLVDLAELTLGVTVAVPDRVIGCLLPGAAET